ncbi:MAG: 3'-5' exonuclease [Deltaproteobacteria bacterium]|nr:3'-5' exonuclease [Deltaproteobacteria bacterium]
MAEDLSVKVVSDIPDALLEKFMQSDVVAVDTELQGLRMGRDQVCLVQMCDRQGNVCLVRPNPPQPPANLARLMTSPKVLKVFHYALSDVAFLKSSLGLECQPFVCTKVMSKLVRTYTGAHGLKDLVQELAGVKLEKELQQTNWGSAHLTAEQLRYAANDVVYLIQVYDTLKRMIVERGTLPSGMSLVKLNEISQAVLPTMVELLLNGYGDRDNGWETGLFSH